VIELYRYQLEGERVPVTQWLSSLRDMRARAQIEVRLRRVSTGNFGDTKPVGDGVLELRIDVGAGAGYRMYYGKHGLALVILLCGGDKGSQQSDIALAKSYWTDWKRRNA
jgi:putative addiction module killer protein